jgi:uncharacterized protein (TIGR00251 family)
MFQQTRNGVSFKVEVISKASRSEIVDWENNELKVRVAAVPEKGEANAELLRHLAEIFGVAKSKVQLMQGEKSRQKCVCIVGLSLVQMQDKLKAYLAKREKVK